jgi:hypothetical protein
MNDHTPAAPQLPDFHFRGTPTEVILQLRELAAKYPGAEFARFRAFLAEAADLIETGNPDCRLPTSPSLTGEDH